MKNKVFLKVHFVWFLSYLTSSTSLGQNPEILHIFNENNVIESPTSPSVNNDKSFLSKTVKMQAVTNTNAKKNKKYCDTSIAIMLYNIIYIIVIF